MLASSLATAPQTPVGISESDRLSEVHVPEVCHSNLSLGCKFGKVKIQFFLRTLILLFHFLLVSHVAGIHVILTPR